jgi:arginase family enzyme
MIPPVVLDIDGSVGALPGSLVLPLGAWQERVRFGCGMRAFDDFSKALDQTLPSKYGTVFLGSGDFHHVSHALIARRAADGMFKVVVFDNHPDNMRFPFGIHCGSWVRHVAALPWVSHVHVLGITSRDVAAVHAWENYFTPLRSGKLTNWCIGVDTGWAARVGLGDRFLSFDSAAELLGRFTESARRDRVPVYLTIDKDVLSPAAAHTNWDQGCMSEQEMMETITHFRGRLIGSDITGDVSSYRYRTWWKRWLSTLDRQPDVSGSELAEWQREQHAINLRLLDAIAACY